MKRHMAQPFRLNAKRIRIIHHLQSLLIQTRFADQRLMLGIVDPQIPFHQLVEDPYRDDAEHIRKRIVEDPVGIVKYLTPLIGA